MTENECTIMSSVPGIFLLVFTNIIINLQSDSTNFILFICLIFHFVVFTKIMVVINFSFEFADVSFLRNMSINK